MNTRPTTPRCICMSHMTGDPERVCPKHGTGERFVPSSGNVWRDLGFPDADERQAEADAMIDAIRAERTRKALRPEYV